MIRHLCGSRRRGRGGLGLCLTWFDSASASWSVVVGAWGPPSGRGVPPQAVPACAPVRQREDVRAAVCRAVPGSPSTATLAVLRPWPASPAPGADGSSSRGCRLSGSALGPETRVPDLGTTPRKTAPGRVDCLNADAPPAGPAAQAPPHGPSGAPSRSPRCSRACRGPCLRDGL